MPIKPLSQRKLIGLKLFPKNIYRKINVGNDADYICYLAVVISFFISVTFTLLLLLDAVVGSDIFFSSLELSNRKIVFFETYLMGVCKVLPLVALLFYFRIRLFIDIKNDHVPFLLNVKFLKNRSKLGWFTTILPIFFLAIFMISSPASLLHIFRHPSLENDLAVISFYQLATVFVFPWMVGFLISSGLIIEKALKHFPQAQSNLDR